METFGDKPMLTSFTTPPPQQKLGDYSLKFLFEVIKGLLN